MTATTYIAVCAVCGYQWNENAISTFALYCPTCNSNMVFESDFDKPKDMGEDYDGKPWY